MKTNRPLIKTFDEFKKISTEYDRLLEAYRFEIKTNGIHSKHAITLEKMMIEIEELMRKSSRYLKMYRLGISLVKTQT